MKPNFRTSIFLSICVAILSLSFADDSKSPKSVALNFLNAFKRMDYETAKQYSSEETKKMLDLLKSFSEMIPDSIKTKLEQSEFSITKSEEVGTKCTVYYLEDSTQADVKLLKINGDWKVQMTKDDGANEESTSPKTSIKSSSKPTKK